MRNIWYLILIFCLMPCLAYAQAKPKRDTSKDRSVIVAKKQKEGTERKEVASVIVPKKQKEGTERKGVASVERKSNSRKAVVGKRKASYKRKYNVAHSYSASYLTVNRQSVSLSSTLSQNGGKTYFDVGTDGKEWTVIGLPHWCKMTR